MLKRIQGSGTHLSTELRGHADKITAVALVCPDFADSFGVKFIGSLEEALARRDTLMVLKINKNPLEDDKALLELMQKGINNFVVWPSGRTELNSVCYRLRALGANMVFFDRVIPEGYADFVGLDNVDAVIRLLEHARSRGGKRFTFLSLAGITGDSTEIRRKAFVDWCEAYNAEYDIFDECISTANSEFIHAMLEKHAEEEQRRAYICVNDYTALYLAERLENTGLLYSIDGLITENSSGIISMVQPVAELAEKAVELIFEQQELGDKWKARKVILKGEIIE